jgi:hypothetical protein
MDKFHCEIWGQKINETQYYLKRDPGEYYKNPYCIDCPKYRDLILQKLPGGPLSIEEPREKEVKINTPKREKPKKKPTKIFRDRGLKKRCKSLKADKNGLKGVRKPEGQEFPLNAFFKGGRIAYMEQLVEKIPYILNLDTSF